MKKYAQFASLSIIACLFSISCKTLKSPAGFSSRNWNGGDVAGHTFARFEYLTGPQEFNVKLDNNQPFTFKYAFDLTEGSINFSLKSDTRTLLTQTFSGKASDSISITPAANEKFKMILRAADAKGNFDLSYAPKGN
jgi:hypothetical protein